MFQPNLLRISVKGFLMGIADVIPGISGGTMALILGIYPRLIVSIRSFDMGLLKLVRKRQLKESLAHIDAGFLLALGIGIFGALFFFTRLISLPKLIQTHPEPIFAFFFGLIVASVAVLIKQLNRLAFQDYLLIMVGVVVGWSIVNIVPIETPNDTWFISLTGALAICALILPGISGSFILLILNKYVYILEGIGNLRIDVIAPFAFGATIGLFTFSRAISWLLKHHYRQTLTAMIGIIIGSLWVIWPFQNRVYEMIEGKPRLLDSGPIFPTAISTAELVAVTLTISGFFTAWYIFHLAMRPNTR